MRRVRLKENDLRCNPQDCDHKALKKLSEKEFRKQTEIIGVQKGSEGDPDLLLGNCKLCYSTIAIELPIENPAPKDMFIVEMIDFDAACYCEGLCHPYSDCENNAVARCTFYGHSVLLCTKCMKRHQTAFKKLKANPLEANPEWWTERDEAMYQAIVDSFRQRGENLAKAKQIAAATVNKWRSEHRQTMAARKKRK